MAQKIKGQLKVAKKEGGKKMARQAVDKEALFDLAKEGKSASEIMEELGIKTKQTLKNALTDLMIERGQVLNVPGIVGRATSNLRKLGSTGIQIPAKLLTGHFKEGDEFRVDIQGDTITLTKQ